MRVLLYCMYGISCRSFNFAVQGFDGVHHLPPLFRQTNDRRICPQDRNPIPEDGGVSEVIK